MRPGLRLAAGLATAIVCLAEAPALERAYPSVVEVRGETSPGQSNQGSGVVIAPGVVATNAHVLRNAYRVSVHQDRQAWEVSALCISPEHDLVLLKIPSLPLPPVEIASEASLAKGMRLVSVGYPGGHGPTPSNGALLAFWSWRGSQLLQTDATIRPGSSGGGLFTEDGRLAGITTFFLPENPLANFAIPAEWVASLENGGQASTGIRCTVLIADRFILEFQDLIGEDPRNREAWDDLTRRWVAQSPADAQAWFARGTALEMELQANPRDPASLQEATTSYRQAVTLDPEHAKAWNNLGSSLDLQNRFPEAQAAFRRAIALKPGFATAWLNLGASLLNSGTYREAVKALEQAVALAPDEPQGWANLAFCEARLRRWPEAAAHYRLALSYSPFRAEWWGERYEVCQKLHRTAEAKEALEHIKQLAPGLARRLRSTR